MKTILYVVLATGVLFDVGAAVYLRQLVGARSGQEISKLAATGTASALAGSAVRAASGRSRNGYGNNRQ